MALIMGKVAELAAKRLMAGFIVSRLGPVRAFKKLTSLGYMIPRNQFSRLYYEARDVNRAMAKLLALGEDKLIPKALITPTALQGHFKRVYAVEFDVYDKSGKFYKTGGYGLTTDANLERGLAEEMAFHKAEDYWSEEKGWSVRNPRLVKVMERTKARR